MATVSELLQLATQYHRANRLPRAERTYRKILGKQPTHPDALHGLAVIAKQVGQYQTAEELLNTLLEAHPESVKAWFSLGNLRQAQAQLPDAMIAYEQVLKLQPDAAAAHNNLGYILQQQGKGNEAIAHYRKALELQPECVEADVNWGNTLHAQGKLSHAKQIHYAALNDRLGVERYQQGDVEAAIAYSQQAIALNPDLAPAHYHLGIALQAQGNPDDAIACHQKALELAPDARAIYFSLGRLYQTQNELETAAKVYREGLIRTNPHYAAAINTRESSATAEAHRSPELTLGEVTFKGHRFPAIPPVTSEEHRPFWSVIIPLYNRKAYLLECLASVLAQWSGSEQMEILVMDNASDPPLFDLVDSMGRGIVRYYLNAENIGPRRNFNRGIALSRGHWIHLLPEDEYVLPGFYDRLQRSLENCPDSVGAAFTGYENINAAGKVIFSQTHRGLHRGINSDWLERIGVSNPLNPCAVLVKRSTHEKLGGYDLENFYTPDWELYKRIAAVTDWWCEPEILARYREHAHNMSTEVFSAGAQGAQYRLGIEMSASYLPEEITAKSRRHYFNVCLRQTSIPLKAGNIVGALRLIQEALKIDSSPQAAQTLFTWLATEAATPLRTEIITKLRDISVAETLDDFYFAYP
ncbi:MAG: tetratricopeptide repeat protein [Leptolyngbyaceae cyanobacterium]